MKTSLLFHNDKNKETGESNWKLELSDVMEKVQLEFSSNLENWEDLKFDCDLNVVDPSLN